MGRNEPIDTNANTIKQKTGNQPLHSVTNELCAMCRSAAAQSTSQLNHIIQTQVYKALEEKLPMEKKKKKKS